MARRDGCVEFYDRAVGSLLGLAVGAPVEFRRRDTFEPVTDMRAGGGISICRPVRGLMTLQWSFTLEKV